MNPTHSPIKLGLLFLSFLLLGCTASQVKLASRSSVALNQDANHQSFPVLARVYQLKDKKHFEAATFNGLWKDDNQLLGQDLISKDEILIYPGEQKVTTVARHQDAQYIAVVALFRDYKQADWRVIAPVSRKISFTFENNQLKLGS